MTQKEYLKKVLQKFNTNSDTKFVSTPVASHFKLKATMSPTTVKEREYVSRTLCSVGSLIYAMVCTMPDLSQVVSMISRYIHDTSRGH